MIEKNFNIFFNLKMLVIISPNFDHIDVIFPCLNKFLKPSQCYLLLQQISCPFLLWLCFLSFCFSLVFIVAVLCSLCFHCCCLPSLSLPFHAPFIDNLELIHCRNDTSPHFNLLRQKFCILILLPKNYPFKLQIATKIIIWIYACNILFTNRKPPLFYIFKIKYN